MISISKLPFLQENLGKILLNLAETHEDAIIWLCLNVVRRHEGVDSASGDVKVQHHVDYNSGEGIHFLHVRCSIFASFTNFNFIFWEIHCCFCTNNTQFCTAKLWAKAKSVNNGEPTALNTLFEGEIPDGEEGVQKIQEVCQLTLNHMIHLLSKQTATEIYKNYIQSKSHSA